MNNSRMFLLVSGLMINCAINAIDIELYITGNKVDAQGKNFLHILAENCNNDNFQIELKPFDLAEKLSAEDEKIRRQFSFLAGLPQEQRDAMGFLLIASKAEEMINAKDNNGNTALDILRKKEQEKSCERCRLGIQLLEQITPELEKLVNLKHN